MRDLALLVALALLACTTLAAAQTPPPDDVWVNGVVYTVDAKFSRAEALAVRDGRILAVGTSAGVRKMAGLATKIHDLGGRCVTPGLIDSHGHMVGLGDYATGRLDLHDTRTFDALVQRVKEAVAKAKPGDWILGGRWDQSLWGLREFPHHGRVSAVSPENPVWLERVDGHSGLANAKAMQLAGITRETPNPPGGEVLRGRTGDPNGMFIDNATRLIEEKIPGGRATLADRILRAQERCLAAGLTGVHDAGIGPEEVAAYRQLLNVGKLKVRIYAMLRGSLGPDYFRRNRPMIHERFTVRALKLMADGALGSRGAWLLEPYADRPTADGKPYSGLPVTQPEFIRQVAAAAAAGGWQVCTHAIGDRAIRETLDAYEIALKGAGDRRFRIEHAQVVALSDLARFPRLRVIPSMQPSHATSDMRWAEARLGPVRIGGAYAWRKFIAAGCRIAAGSDFPVESENPLWGIYAAVARQDHQGNPSGGWYPAERMTREEALRAFTANAAYAAFEEDRKGSLRPGCFADFVIWNADIVRCPARALLAASPVEVVIGGAAVKGEKTPRPDAG